METEVRNVKVASQNEHLYTEVHNQEFLLWGCSYVKSLMLCVCLCGPPVGFSEALPADCGAYLDH